MSNDQDWQRRTDEWINATNESRKRKEKRNAQKLDNQSKGSDYEKNSKIGNQEKNLR